MAKQPFTIPTTNTTTRNSITGANDNVLAEFVTTQTTRPLPDNSISVEKNGSSQLLADGTIFNLGMSMGPHPERLGSCAFHAKSSPGESPLVNLRYAHFCEDCQQLGCPKCVRRSKKDKKYRCRRCEWKFRIWQAIKRLFFRPVYLSLLFVGVLCMAHYLGLLAETMDTYRLYDRDDRAAQIKSMMDLNLVSEEQAQAYLYALQPLVEEVQRTRNTLARAPTQEEMYPEGLPNLIVGELEERDQAPVGLFLHDNMSLILSGNAGSGKSTALYNLVLAIDRHNQVHPEDFISLIIWESKDGELLSIAQVIPNCMVVSTAQTLRLGLDPPENVPTHLWNNEVGRMIGAHGLKAGSISVVEMLNFFSRILNREPTIGPRLAASFENLYEMCDVAPPGLFESKEQYLLSVKQVLHQPAKATANLWRAARGLDLERDIIRPGKHLIIDDRGQEDWVGAMSRDILIKKLIMGRQHGNKTAPCRVFLLGDEFGNYISRKAEEQYVGSMPLIECMRKGRSLRISVCVGVNALGPVSRTVLVDANYHFLFRMKDQESLREAANTLLLPPGSEAILPALPPGQFLFRGPAWPETVLARIYPNLLPPVSKEVHYDTLPFVPARKLCEMPEVPEGLNQEKIAAQAQKFSLVRSAQSNLNKWSDAFLRAACPKLGFPAAYIFKGLGNIPYQTQIAIRKELEDLKYVAFEDWRIERSTRLVQEVLPDGYLAAQKPSQHLKGRGSIGHRVATLWVETKGLRLGYEHAVSEFVVPGTSHPVDMAWYNGKLQDLHLFEIVREICDNLPANLKITFASGVKIEKLIIVTAQKAITQKIQKLLAEDVELMPYQSKISFELITPYLDAFVAGG